MDECTHQVRLAHWKAVIEQCNARPEGQSARSWLRENSISDKQYYYWQRIIRRESFEQMAKELPCQVDPQQNEISFAEFVAPATPAPSQEESFERSAASICADAVVKTDRGTVLFTNSTSSKLIRSVMEVILHA